MHVKREHVTKFSGVFIDENLSWKQHINIVSSKISKSIDILYKSKDVLSKQYLQQLYFSFIHNYVNYENIVCASTSKQQHVSDSDKDVQVYFYWCLPRQYLHSLHNLIPILHNLIPISTLIPRISTLIPHVSLILVPIPPIPLFRFPISRSGIYR